MNDDDDTKPIVFFIVSDTHTLWCYNSVQKSMRHNVASFPVCIPKAVTVRRILADTFGTSGALVT